MMEQGKYAKGVSEKDVDYNGAVSTRSTDIKSATFSYTGLLNKGSNNSFSYSHLAMTVSDDMCTGSKGCEAMSCQSI